MEKEAGGKEMEKQREMGKGGKEKEKGREGEDKKAAQGKQGLKERGEMRKTEGEVEAEGNGKRREGQREGQTARHPPVPARSLPAQAPLTSPRPPSPGRPLLPAAEGGREGGKEAGGERRPGRDGGAAGGAGSGGRGSLTAPAKMAARGGTSGKERRRFRGSRGFRVRFRCCPGGSAEGREGKALSRHKAIKTQDGGTSRAGMERRMAQDTAPIRPGRGSGVRAVTVTDPEGEGTK